MRDAADGIVGVILAGGQARRMGGVDKALLSLGGRTLLERTTARARPQVSELLLNANGDVARFASFGLAVVPDSIEGFLGPVAGILSGLEWMRANRPDAEWLATFACDAPFFPQNLVAKLRERARSTGASAAFATSGGRRHSVFAVWSAAIGDTCQSVLGVLGLRKVDDWMERVSGVPVEFSVHPFDAFLNINSPADLARAEALLASESTLGGGP